MSPPVLENDAPARVSPDYYLRLECEAGEKHEYYFGGIRATDGTSYARNHICANPPVEPYSQLRGKSAGFVVRASRRRFGFR